MELEFHVPKHKFHSRCRTIENENQLIDSMFIKQNGDRKVISSFKKSFEGLDEHQILEKVSNNNNFDQTCYLLFYHWYERRYNVNVIQRENSIVFNPIIKNSIIPVVRITNKVLHDEVREEFVKKIHSKRFEGFSIFYEYFYDFLPNIEKFTFEEFIGREFVYYLIDLFPYIFSIRNDNGFYYRFPKIKINRHFEKYYTNLILIYTRGLPNFYPRINDRRLYFSYCPTSFIDFDVKEIENEIRVLKGLPKIGEGWISETTLYYQLKESFVNEIVVHHGNPKWLGLQHVDIWFPDYRIGIEYQGIQHDKPIEYFGGEESFLKGLERDKRKKDLFVQNDSKLIEVREGFDLNVLIKEIELHIKEFRNLNTDKL